MDLNTRITRRGLLITTGAVIVAIANIPINTLKEAHQKWQKEVSEDLGSVIREIVPRTKTLEGIEYQLLKAFFYIKKDNSNNFAI